jgi:hypothetical protein
LAIRALDFKQVAGPEILDRRNGTERRSGFIDAGKADQVGVIIFAFFQRRQLVAVDLDQRSAQRFGG